MASESGGVCALVRNPANLGEGLRWGWRGYGHRHWKWILHSSGHFPFWWGGSLTSLLGLNFPWPRVLWPAGPSERMASNKQLLCRSQLTLHKPCPGPGPLFALSDCQGGGSLGGASDQRRQRPEDRVTEGWGRRGLSFQPAEAAAFRPPSCSCRDSDSGPDHSPESQDFSHYLLPPTLCSALPSFSPPSPPPTPHPQNCDLCPAGDIGMIHGWVDWIIPGFSPPPGKASAHSGSVETNSGGPVKAREEGVGFSFFKLFLVMEWRTLQRRWGSGNLLGWPGDPHPAAIRACLSSLPLQWRGWGNKRLRNLANRKCTRAGFVNRHYPRAGVFGERFSWDRQN